MAEVYRRFVQELHRHLAIQEQFDAAVRLPGEPRHIVVRRQTQRKAMLSQLIERLVVERSHKLRLCRCTVGVGNVQRPGLTLSWHESVAEGCPLDVEVCVGLRTLYARRMQICLAVLHPRYGESNAVAPLLFICYRASAHLVAQVGSAVLYNLIARNERVDNVLYAVARTELHEDRSRLALELSR